MAALAPGCSHLVGGRPRPFLGSHSAWISKKHSTAPARLRCRRAILRRVLSRAAELGLWSTWCFVVLAYMFGLRVPSELIRQARKSLFCRSETRISYGPIRRKGQLELQTLCRWCCCRDDKLLCLHDWLLAVFRLHPHDQLFPSSAAHYMNSFKSILRHLAVPESTISRVIVSGRERPWTFWKATACL